MSENKEQLVELTADIVASYVNRNSVPLDGLGQLIAITHAALSKLGGEPEAPPTAALVPAIPVRKSVTAEAIICLEDGKSFKSLKRHLGAVYNLTPDQYRAKWGLPADYPMVAPDYAERRSALAKSIGLGRKFGRHTVVEASPAPKAKRGKQAKA